MFSKLKQLLSTHFFDKDLCTHPKHYILQSLLVFLCLGLILTMCHFMGKVVVASLGASSFILFASPHANAARLRYPIGGYLCGVVSGCAFHALYLAASSWNFAGKEHALPLICAAAAAFAMFLMVITNLGHPPAAALALGLTGDPQCAKTALAAIASILALSLAKHYARNHLRNL